MKRIARLVPNFLKPIVRLVYKAVRNPPLRLKLAGARTPKTTRDELQAYWRRPWDEGNRPGDYLKPVRRSRFLVALVVRYAHPRSSILEVGCNAGRNLHHLFAAGFQHLSAIEISQEALELLTRAYPEMAAHARVINEPAEEALPKFADDEFDVTFTMAVLEHIPPASEFVFPEIVRVTKHILITIEDERSTSWRHFPRNYRKAFERLGLKQIHESLCRDAGLGGGFVARVFIKQHARDN